MTTAALQTFETKLKEMIGNTYMLNANCFKFLNYTITGNQILIGTDKKVLQIELFNAHVALDKFLLTDPEEKPNSHMVQFQMTSLEGASEIKNIMMDTIKKIQDNKDYIPQASAVNESVKTLLDFAKTEIQMYETMYKINYPKK